MPRAIFVPPRFFPFHACAATLPHQLDRGGGDNEAMRGNRRRPPRLGQRDKRGQSNQRYHYAHQKSSSVFA
jgi:hypothetical protein